MSQNLQNFVKFQKFQFENLVDFEKCCKTHIFLQKSEPIQPKTSNILPKFCGSADSRTSAVLGSVRQPAGEVRDALPRRRLGRRREEALVGASLGGITSSSNLTLRRSTPFLVGFARKARSAIFRSKRSKHAGSFCG